MLGLQGLGLLVVPTKDYYCSSPANFGGFVKILTQTWRRNDIFSLMSDV